MLQIGPYVIPDTTPRPTSGQTARVLISSASRSAPAGRPRALLRLPSPRYAPAAHPRALLRPPVAALCSGRPFPRSAPPRIAALPSTSPPLAARASTFRRHSPPPKGGPFGRIRRRRGQCRRLQGLTPRIRRPIHHQHQMRCCPPPRCSSKGAALPLQEGITGGNFLISDGTAVWIGR
jgi:hypothetical protein